MTSTEAGPVRRRLARIEFLCDAHRRPAEAAASGTLTTVGGKWAYCHASRIVGHRWVATGGVPIGRILKGRAG
ncbi:MAG TPA: hypothetical protein VGT60_07875 [Candidatus Limnocylindria bacterium]|nr:hypothetical protein [Candidatus Limnocylindria bacterium]